MTRSRGGWDGGNDTRADGEVQGECGKPEYCHPKNQVSVDRDQVSVTRSRGGDGGTTRGQRASVENARIATQKIEAGLEQVGAQSLSHAALIVC